MSTTSSADMDAISTSFLSSTGETFSSRQSSSQQLPGFLRPLSSRRLTTEPSVTVRQHAIEQLLERRNEWAKSKKNVIVDLIWNTLLILLVIIGLLFWGKDEVPNVPLRLWLSGYGFHCFVHMICVWIDFQRRLSMPISDFGSTSNSSYSSESDCFANFLDSVYKMFSFVWWITGFYWILSGGHMLEDNAPNLTQLTINLLSIDMFILIIIAILACLMRVVACFFLPFLLAGLCLMSIQEALSKDVIEKVTGKYRFRRIYETENPLDGIYEGGGIMVEYDTDNPIEHALSADDAGCAICLLKYENECELLELPCHHHFHYDCINKWLHTKPTCPLCKYEISMTDNRRNEQV